VLERDDIFQFGLDTLEGCWHAYNVTPTGISPECISLSLSPSLSLPPSPFLSLFMAPRLSQTDFSVEMEES
jgi:hypothetical protein